MTTIQQKVRVVQEKITGDSADALQQGDVVQGAKSHDTTPAPTPTLRRAMAFELAPDGSTQVPNPPPPRPAPPARRDPVLLELGNIEMNAKIQFISLSNDPEASFKTGKVMELPVTGYDEDNRIATVVLNAEMMKDVGLNPGERIVVRQLDKNGNASDGIFAHLDPSGWASQQIQQPDGTRVRGAQIDYQVGLHNVSQVDADPTKLGQMQRVMGTAVADQLGPVLLEKNVKVLTTTWTDKEREYATHLLNGPGVQNILARAPFSNALTVANMKQALETAGNFGLGEKTLDIFKALVNDPKLFARLDTAAYGGGLDGVIGTQHDLPEIVNNKKSTFFAMEMAVEPGTSGTVRNNRTGEVFNFQLNADQRTCHFKLPNLENGDQLTLELRDGAGNAGKAYAFEYSAESKDGKKHTNVLSAQLDAFTTDPLSAILEVSGKKMRKVVDGRSIGASNATPAWLLAGTSLWVGDGFFKPYHDNAEKLGLPTANKAQVNGVWEQTFEKGKLTWDAATGQANVAIDS